MRVALHPATRLGDPCVMSSVEERVKKLICEQLGVKEDEIKGDWRALQKKFLHKLGYGSISKKRKQSEMEDDSDDGETFEPPSKIRKKSQKKSSV